MAAMTIDIQWLGRQPKAHLEALQQDLIQKVAEGAAPSTVLIAEHDPIITIGHGPGSEAHGLQGLGPIPVRRVLRGGGPTYHGPGQLVVYATMKLEGAWARPRPYMRRLEHVPLEVLSSHGLQGALGGEVRGVDVAGRKLASVGIFFNKRVAGGGFLLNVATDLAIFEKMVPCGIEGVVMGSMAELLDPPPTLDEVAATIAAAFPRVFDEAYEVPEEDR